MNVKMDAECRPSWGHKFNSRLDQEAKEKDKDDGLTFKRENQRYQPRQRRPCEQDQWYQQTLQVEVGSSETSDGSASRPWGQLQGRPNFGTKRNQQGQPSINKSAFFNIFR